MARVEIKEHRCKGCGLCIEVCPRHCLVASSELNGRGVVPARFDGSAGECNGCMSCALICPDVAIEVIEDERVE